MLVHAEAIELYEVDVIEQIGATAARLVRIDVFRRSYNFQLVGWLCVCKRKR